VRRLDAGETAKRHRREQREQLDVMKRNEEVPKRT